MRDVFGWSPLLRYLEKSLLCQLDGQFLAPAFFYLPFSLPHGGLGEIVWSKLTSRGRCFGMPGKSSSGGWSSGESCVTLASGSSFLELGVACPAIVRLRFLEK